MARTPASILKKTGGSKASRSKTTAERSAATPDLDPFELAGRLRLSVTRLARILRHQDAGTLAPTLSAALATVDREGPLTLGDLAQREHVAPPSITKAVDKLVGMGFVERRADTTDRRVSQVHITAAGHRHVMQNRSRRTAWLATRLQELPDADVERLAAAASVLERLVQHSAEPLADRSTGRRP
jgi:DNA-binding MarR family transcriptional regulator